ncbi:hypothetical protein ACFL9U_12575 [Thermodesulfobacteriota bacterium]
MIRYLAVFILFIVMIHPLRGAAQTDFTKLVKEIQPAVVTVITYDIKHETIGIGSGKNIQSSNLNAF